MTKKDPSKKKVKKEKGAGDADPGSDTSGSDQVNLRHDMRLMMPFSCVNRTLIWHYRTLVKVEIKYEKARVTYY